MEKSNPLRAVIRLLSAALMLAVIFVGIPAAAFAQGDGDTAQLTGRLGGTLDEMQTRFGAPSWTDTSLIGYNSQTLAGVDSIVVVYYDERNVVDQISLVYLSKPAQFSDSAAIAAAVAEVAPLDGTCSSTASTAPGMGTEVYACQSAALASAFPAAVLTQSGLLGAAGSYNYSVDPTADEYYEIVIQPGTDTDTPPPTAVPTTPPQPTAAPSLTDQYPPVADVRELAIGRGYEVSDKLSLSGSVFNIQFENGVTSMQIWVNAPDGSTEPVVVAYEGDSSGIFEGTWITAYGTYIGPVCGTNSFGAEICQPLVFAVVVEH